MSKELPKQCSSCGGMGCGKPCGYGMDKEQESVATGTLKKLK